MCISWEKTRGFAIKSMTQLKLFWGGLKGHFYVQIHGSCKKIVNN